MADPKAENAVREADGALGELRARWEAAREYLKIDPRRERHQELSRLAEDPELWTDQDHARAVTTELGRLGADLDAFDELGGILDDAVVLVDFCRESLAGGEGDWSLIEELVDSTNELDRRLGELETQSLLSGPYDDNDGIVEIHAGAGGTDAQDWAEMLVRMYSRWAERRGFAVEVDEVTEGQEAGILSATFIVKGRYAYGWLSAERGVHRLVRISPFDSQARRQTSFASLEVTPLLDDDTEVEIDEKDLRVDTYRSSGAGGQHVNKTDSAIRLTHLPTGVVVSCQNERSQHQNRARAMQILAAKLAERARLERQAELDALSGSRSDNAWGSQIRSYVQAPYQLVKDLRTDFETGNVEAVLDGDLDGFMEAELRRQRAANP
ncbi:MAG: peptide chain release factor 2 [Acidimicrobiaceae bacterium]|nr:peptide chain release factor 2 [Acidimicrobiaceae bacterium]